MRRDLNPENVQAYESMHSQWEDKREEELKELEEATEARMNELEEVSEKLSETGNWFVELDISYDKYYNIVDIEASHTKWRLCLRDDVVATSSNTVRITRRLSEINPHC